MAWESKEEHAMLVVRDHMKVMDEKKKLELSELYTKLIFPLQGNSWTDVKWTTKWGVTFVTMWDKEHLMKNIRFAMIQEMMGLGPTKYCIVHNAMPNFHQRMLVLLNFLPHKKMCLYLQQFILDEPFNRSPWREIMDEISNRCFTLKHPIFKMIYYTQQFVIFQRTGVFGPTYYM